MGKCRFVGDQRNRVVGREMAHFPRKVNGYPGVVPTTEVVVSRQDEMSMLKKRASAHRLKKSETGYRTDPDGHYRCWTRAGPAG